MAAAAVVVQGPVADTPADPFPEPRPWSSSAAADLANRLGSVPGVVAAVPDRTFYAQPVIGGRPDETATAGHGWAGARLGDTALVAGAAPRTDRGVVLGRAHGRAPGDPVTLLTAVGPAAYTVTGVVDGPGLFLSDAAAARLAPGSGRSAWCWRPVPTPPRSPRRRAGPVVALLGVWSASRRAAKVRPLEALREAAVEARPMGRARWAAGLLCTVAGLALAVGTATADDAAGGGTYALYSAMALVLGAAALAPAVVPPVVRVLTWPLRRARLMIKASLK